MFLNTYKLKVLASLSLNNPPSAAAASIYDESATSIFIFPTRVWVVLTLEGLPAIIHNVNEGMRADDDATE